jgi:hypothetical protein
MGDLERVMQALRKADAAGNTEDAKRLAQIARKLQNQPHEEQGDGIMPYVNRGIATTLGGPVDAITAGINLIPGVDIKEPVGGRKSIERGMETMGIKLPKEGATPETMGEHVGRGVGEVAGAMNLVGGATSLLARGGSLVAQVSRSMVSSMAKHPYLAMTSEITGGAGSGMGRGIAEQEGAGPTTQMVGEIAGGVAGGMAPTVVYYAPTMIALRTGKNIVQKISTPFSKKRTRS